MTVIAILIGWVMISLLPHPADWVVETPPAVWGIVNAEMEPTDADDMELPTAMLSSWTVSRYSAVLSAGRNSGNGACIPDSEMEIILLKYGKRWRYFKCFERKERVPERGISVRDGPLKDIAFSKKTFRRNE